MNKVIAVDFDGTVVDHCYPDTGPDVPYAVEVLKDLVSRGYKIILWTMRSGKELDDAVKWYKDRDISLYGININPDQISWTTSPKAYAQIYIDDAALGCPLYKFAGFNRVSVDWLKVVRLLHE